MYEVLHHTADVRLRVTAPTLIDLFRDALRGLMETMKPQDVGEPRAGSGERTAESESAHIDIDSPDPTSLLVDFLSEALTRAHIARAAFDRVEIESLSDTSMRATLTGHHVSGFGEDVKAVTYHEAEVVQDASGWSTTLVLDI